MRARSARRQAGRQAGRCSAAPRPPARPPARGHAPLPCALRRHQMRAMVTSNAMRSCGAGWGSARERGIPGTPACWHASSACRLCAGQPKASTHACLYAEPELANQQPANNQGSLMARLVVEDGPAGAPPQVARARRQHRLAADRIPNKLVEPQPRLLRLDAAGQAQTRGAAGGERQAASVELAPVQGGASGGGGTLPGLQRAPQIPSGSRPPPRVQFDPTRAAWLRARSAQAASRPWCRAA